MDPRAGQSGSKRRGFAGLSCASRRSPCREETHPNWEWCWAGSQLKGMGQSAEEGSGTGDSPVAGHGQEKV